ncbi:MAG: phosphatase PAP2 family protein [Nostocoides sp.]
MTGIGSQPWGIDWSTLTWIDAHRIAPVTWVAELLLFVASRPLVLVVLVLVLAALAIRLGLLRIVLAAGAAAALAIVIAGLGKGTFGRPRPPEELRLEFPLDGSAFPSSHAAFTAAAAMAAVILWRDLRLRSAASAAPWAGVATAATLAFGVVAVIGLAMIYLGAHWVSDVLIGWVLGSGVGWAVAVVARRLGASGGGATLPRG